MQGRCGENLFEYCQNWLDFGTFNTQVFANCPVSHMYHRLLETCLKESFVTVLSQKINLLFKSNIHVEENLFIH